MDIKKILVCATKGSEELELTCIINVMRRANFSVKLAKVDANETMEELNGIPLLINCARGIKILADCILDESMINNDWDAVIIPGGKLGAENLAKSKIMIDIFKNQKNIGKLYGAICASPALTLLPNGLLEDEKATCYPAFKDSLGEIYEDNKNVVRSNNLITSRGPGTAIEFALEIVEILSGTENKEKLKKEILF